MSNQLLINGVAMDLSPDTAILPSFQASDLLQPDKIQSDFTPELSVPATGKNHELLGHAAYDGNTARIPYKSLANVTLLSEGVEIMPRARMYLKGYESGSYQLQLVAGNKRFVEALGDKKLSDLDFSRFTHTRTIGNIAQRASSSYAAANGWFYEVLDRGKPLDLANLAPEALTPTLSAQLVLEQMATDAGFTVAYPADGLLPKLLVPSVAPATYSEAFLKARRLRVGLGPGHEREGGLSANRDSQRHTIPYDDFKRTIGTVPPLVPTISGVYEPTQYTYTADTTMYVDIEARTVVLLRVGLAKASAQVFMHINGVEIAGGEKKVVDKDTRFSIGFSAQRVLLQSGDVLTMELKLKGEEPGFLGTRWSFAIFQDQVYSQDGQSIPVDKFEVTVLSEQPPGAEVLLSGWLPDLSQLDFFKALVQVCGFSVQTDAYEDLVTLSPSRAVLDNVAYAKDWTGKRDAPDLPTGQARSVAYRYSSFGQRNWLKWKEDKTVREGYGDGSLFIEDETLPATYTMSTLPFAATERSAAALGLLLIQNYKLRENEDPFAEPEYDTLSPAPRLTLLAERTQEISVVEGATRFKLIAPVSYFIDAAEELSLDAEAYILPVAWAGLRAMLTECRFHKERYRLTAADISAFLSDPNVPIWDGALQGYFSISKINEFTAERSVEVEMMRLHPAYLVPPTPGQRHEFAGSEFFIEPRLSEFY